MSGSHSLSQRIATYLTKQNAAYCEPCLVERLSVASKTAMRAALETEALDVRVGICPDCKMRRQVVTVRSRHAAA
jgi:hypothetical protein